MNITKILAEAAATYNVIEDGVEGSLMLVLSEKDSGTAQICSSKLRSQFTLPSSRRPAGACGGFLYETGVYFVIDAKTQA